MVRMTTLLASAALLASAGALSAQTRAACAERSLVIDRLENRLGETRQSMGMSRGNDAVIEVYASDTTGSWTIIVTLPNGLSCLLASGRMWEPKAERATPTGQPT